MERRLVPRVEGVDIGVSIKKGLDIVMAASQRRIMKRSVSLGVASIDVGVAIKQRAYISQRALLASLKESTIEFSLRCHSRHQISRMQLFLLQ